MTNKKIEQKIEELADKFVFESPKYSGYLEHMVTFKAGAKAALKLAAEAAGEFDKQACKKERAKLFEMSAVYNEESFIEGARWQHEQNAATIGALRLENSYADEVCGRLREENVRLRGLLEATIDLLQNAHEGKMLPCSLIEHKDRLKTKLEAELKEKK